MGVTEFALTPFRAPHPCQLCGTGGPQQDAIIVNLGNSDNSHRQRPAAATWRSSYRNATTIANPRLMMKASTPNMNCAATVASTHQRRHESTGLENTQMHGKSPRHESLGRIDQGFGHASDYSGISIRGFWPDCCMENEPRDSFPALSAVRDRLQCMTMTWWSSAPALPAAAPPCNWPSSASRYWWSKRAGGSAASRSIPAPSPPRRCAKPCSIFRAGANAAFMAAPTASSRTSAPAT